MSFSFEGSFRTKASAAKAVGRDAGLPLVIKQVLLNAISASKEDTDNRYLYIKAQGHQMEADCNSYERSSAELLVEPRYFTPDPGH